jgi:hypothetical protein
MLMPLIGYINRSDTVIALNVFMILCVQTAWQYSVMYHHYTKLYISTSFICILFPPCFSLVRSAGKQYCNNKALLKVVTLVSYIHVYYMKYSNHTLSEHQYPRIWLWHCTTSQKVMGSIPDGVIGISHWFNPSSCTKALGLTQPLTEMSTRNIIRG